MSRVREKKIICGIECLKCSKCGEYKPLDEFGNQKDKSYGKNSWCKKCANLRTKKYRIENKEKIKQSAKKYYDAHKEEINKRNKKLRIEAKNKKTCKNCGETKPISEFYIKYGKPDKWCKNCVDEYNARKIHINSIARTPNITDEEITYLEYLEYLDNNGFKICSKCGEVKSKDSFTNYTLSPDGKYIYCKQCVAKDKKLKK